jgi:TetR/AcrR family transcriptional regulator, fatty acid metabolism regulator protein
MPRQVTKERILAGAAKVFAECGESGTTISQIAREARVSEASIYEYFKGKEDLLLAAATEKIPEVQSIIEDHLFGIKGALGQLRKFVWVYVRHMTENQTHARIALLHLKTSKGFMNTDAYKAVQQLYAGLVEIITKGQEAGEIRPEINPYMARALIMGGIEHITVRWLLKDCSYNLLDQLEQIYDLIEEALKTRPKFSGEQVRPSGPTNGMVLDTTSTQLSNGEHLSAKARGGTP